MEHIRSEIQRYRRILEEASRPVLSEAPSAAACPSVTAKGKPGDVRRQFNQAFKSARQKGYQQFRFNGKVFSTAVAPPKAKVDAACAAGAGLSAQDLLKQQTGKPPQGEREPQAMVQPEPVTVQKLSQWGITDVPAYKDWQSSTPEEKQQWIDGAIKRSGGKCSEDDLLVFLNDYWRGQGKQAAPPAKAPESTIVNDPPTKEQWATMSPEAKRAYQDRKNKAAPGVTGEPGQGVTVPVDGPAAQPAVRRDALPTASQWRAMSSEERRAFGQRMIQNSGGKINSHQVIDQLTTYWKTPEGGK